MAAVATRSGRRAVASSFIMIPRRNDTRDRHSVDIQFGGCDGKAMNCIPITPGWNYIVRLYRPRAEILNGSWKFPEPQPMN